MGGLQYIYIYIYIFTYFLIWDTKVFMGLYRDDIGVILG